MDRDTSDAKRGSIEHIIVLMLENRSFDHLLGNVALHGSDPPVVRPGAGARYAMPLDPGHSHAAVKQQLGVRKPPYAPNNQGFVAAYLDKARGKSPELRDRLSARVKGIGAITMIVAVPGMLWPLVSAIWIALLLGFAVLGFSLVWHGSRVTGHVPRTMLKVIYGKVKRKVPVLVVGLLALGAIFVSAFVHVPELRLINEVVLLAAGATLLSVGTALGKHATVQNSGDVLERAITSSFTPAAIEPLAMLAQEFATCTRWFCPVPGETWPNRNFVHAGTSDGAVDIEYRLFLNPTIFDLLQQHAATLTADPWRVYFRGVPQVLAFPSLWDHLGPEAGPDAPFRTIDRLWTDIENENLPAYSFIEPFHGTAFDATEFEGVPKTTDSQHSGNNKIPIGEYDTGDHLTAGRDFIAGMQLVAELYESLRAKPDLFAKTLLVITYDEHGGFPDREPPPVNAVPPESPGIRMRFYGWLLSFGYGMRASSYDFTMLGPRVPTIIVSPWVPAAPVATTFDHTSIPHTVRKVFGIKTPLSDREDKANTFDHLVSSSDTLRTALPDLNAWRHRPTDPGLEALSPTVPTIPPDNDFTRSLGFVALTLLNYVVAVPGNTPNAKATHATDGQKQRARNKAQRQARRESLAALGRAEAGTPEQLEAVRAKVADVIVHLEEDAGHDDVIPSGER